jgi:hypothetical protein
MDAKKDILMAIGQNPTIKDGILRIETNEWLVPIKDAYPELEEEFLRLEPLQVLENKDSFVTTKDIHNGLWPEKKNAGSVYDQQIYQHISALRTDLKDIGIEGELIIICRKQRLYVQMVVSL